MIKPSLQGIKDAFFYALYGTGGVILANESSKIPQTAQQAKGLENAIETAMVHAGNISPETAKAVMDHVELFGALAILYGAGYLVKRAAKHDAANASSKSSTSKTLTQRVTRMIGTSAIEAVPAATAGAMLLGSYMIAPETLTGIGAYLQQTLQGISTQIGHLYSQYAGSEATVPAQIITHSVAALGLTTAGTALRARFSNSKHGPTLVRYEIDGYTRPFEAMSAQNVGVKINATFGRFLKSSKYTRL